VLGRNSCISKDIYKLLVSPLYNPICNQCYKAQIIYYNIQIKPQTLYTQLSKHTNNGKIHCKVYTKSEFSDANIQVYIQYTDRFVGRTIENEFQY